MFVLYSIWKFLERLGEANYESYKQRTIKRRY